MNKFCLCIILLILPAVGRADFFDDARLAFLGSYTELFNGEKYTSFSRDSKGYGGEVSIRKGNSLFGFMFGLGGKYLAGREYVMDGTESRLLDLDLTLASAAGGIYINLIPLEKIFVRPYVFALGVAEVGQARLPIGKYNQLKDEEVSSFTGYEVGGGLELGTSFSLILEARYHETKGKLLNQESFTIRGASVLAGFAF